MNKTIVGQEVATNSIIDNAKRKRKEYLISILREKQIKPFPFSSGELRFLLNNYNVRIKEYDFDFLRNIVPELKRNATNPIYNLRCLEKLNVDEKIVKSVFYSYYLTKDVDYLEKLESTLKTFPVKEEIKEQLLKNTQNLLSVLKNLTTEYEQENLTYTIENLGKKAKMLKDKYGIVIDKESCKNQIDKTVNIDWQKLKKNNQTLIELVQKDFKRVNKTYLEQIKNKEESDFDIQEYCEKFNERYSKLDFSGLYPYSDAPKNLTPALLAGIEPSICEFDATLLYCEKAIINKDEELLSSLEEGGYKPKERYNFLLNHNFMNFNNKSKRYRDFEGERYDTSVENLQKTNAIIYQMLMNDEFILPENIDDNPLGHKYNIYTLIKKSLIRVGRDYFEEKKQFLKSKKDKETEENYKKLVESLKEVDKDNFNFDKFIEENKIYINNLVEFQKYIKEKHPQVINNLVMSKEENKQKEEINKILREVNKNLITGESFKWLEYHLQTPLSLKEIINSQLVEENKSLIKEYLSNNPDIENSCTAIFFVGENFDKDDAQIINRYIKNNNLPYRMGVVRDAVNRFLNGEELPTKETINNKKETPELDIHKSKKLTETVTNK